MANAMGAKLLIDKGEIKLIKKGDDDYNMVFGLENPTINSNRITIILLSYFATSTNTS